MTMETSAVSEFEEWSQRSSMKSAGVRHYFYLPDPSNDLINAGILSNFFYDYVFMIALFFYDFVFMQQGDHPFGGSQATSH